MELYDTSHSPTTCCFDLVIKKNAWFEKLMIWQAGKNYDIRGTIYWVCSLKLDFINFLNTTKVTPLAYRGYTKPRIKSILNLKHILGNQ